MLSKSPKAWAPKSLQNSGTYNSSCPFDHKHWTCSNQYTSPIRQGGAIPFRSLKTNRIIFNLKRLATDIQKNPWKSEVEGLRTQKLPGTNHLLFHIQARKYHQTKKSRSRWSKIWAIVHHGYEYPCKPKWRREESEETIHAHTWEMHLTLPTHLLKNC